MSLKYKILFCLLPLMVMLFPHTSGAQNHQPQEPTCDDFKFTLLSLGSGSTRITYEHAYNSINSAEFTLGIIGLGWDWMNDSDPRGLLVKLAYKWRLFPQPKANSLLAGFYVKPELVATHFEYAAKTDGMPTTKNTYRYGLLAECGYQLVFGWFLFDIYAGVGPSWGDGNDNNYFHSFMLFPKDKPIAFTSGFRIGVAF